MRTKCNVCVGSQCTLPQFSWRGTTAGVTALAQAGSAPLAPPGLVSLTCGPCGAGSPLDAHSSESRRTTNGLGRPAGSVLSSGSRLHPVADSSRAHYLLGAQSSLLATARRVTDARAPPRYPLAVNDGVMSFSNSSRHPTRICLRSYKDNTSSG